ncbi:MAG TPA: 50S ribosomal protein L11 methyltransferase [bacterium]|nr:50S ribosomal protein L11 methyltransferase [bacterium]
MKWVEITVTTAPQAVEAIANILLESRTGGIVEESPQPGLTLLRGYLPVGPATTAKLNAICARVQALKAYGLDAGPARIETEIVEESGWAQAWKSHFKPFAVGKRLWISPTWDETAPPPEAVIVALDPGMAFGSGLHASTQMCLSVIEEHIRGGEHVFDVGTGSGILSIAAAKLGAAVVLAIDDDPVAVEVTGQNVQHNRVAGRVTVRLGDLLDGVADKADLILANLTADIHLKFLADGPSHLTSGGILAASGIVEDRMPEVEAVARSVGLRSLEVKRDAEWRCLVLTRS